MENRKTDIANRAVGRTKDIISEVSEVKAANQNQSHINDVNSLSDIEMHYIDFVLMNEEEFTDYLYSYRNSENEDLYKN